MSQMQHIQDYVDPAIVLLKTNIGNSSSSGRTRVISYKVPALESGCMLLLIIEVLKCYQCFQKLRLCTASTNKETDSPFSLLFCVNIGIALSNIHFMLVICKNGPCKMLSRTV